MDVDLSVSGFDQLMQGLEDAELIYNRAVMTAMIENALDLLGDAMDLTPVYKGPLRASGMIVDNKNELIAGGKDGGDKLNPALNDNSNEYLKNHRNRNMGNQFEVWIGFNEAYAWKQHEELYHHLTPRDDTFRAKFLEIPTQKNQAVYLENIKDTIEEMLKRARGGGTP